MLILQDILTKLLSILAESGPYILLGFLIAGVLHVFLPESMFARIFGQKGFKPLLRAIGLGSLIPICSCGVVPIGIGAYRSGAGTGTVLAFMTAAPTLSPASVLLSVKLLGGPITFWQVGLVAIGSLLMGLVANRWLAQKTPQAIAATEPTSLELTQVSAPCCSSTPATQPTIEASCCGTPDAAPSTVFGRIREMFHWVFVEFGPSVSLDMLIGLLFAATVLTLVPTDGIAYLTGSKTVWSLLLVILVALPVYTCSMAAIPVVFTFLAAGMSPGAAVAFIIAGPATNFGEMNAIRAQIGWRTALFYFVALLSVAVGSGYLLDHFIQPALPAGLASAGAAHIHQHPPTLLEWASVVILAGMMLLELTRRTRRFLPGGSRAAAGAAPSNVSTPVNSGA